MTVLYLFTFTDMTDTCGLNMITRQYSYYVPHIYNVAFSLSDVFFVLYLKVFWSQILSIFMNERNGRNCLGLRVTKTWFFWVTGEPFLKGLCSERQFYKWMLCIGKIKGKQKYKMLHKRFLKFPSAVWLIKGYCVWKRGKLLPLLVFGC